MAKTITIAKKRDAQRLQEKGALRNTNLYKRLLEAEKNIKIKKYTRADLGL